MARALVKKIKKDPNPVGSTIQSMLTEAQFQTEFGTNWVLMDGRSVSGSDYETITTESTIPDARGMFLRGKNNTRMDGNEDSEGERLLGSYQLDKTRMPRNTAFGTQAYRSQSNLQGRVSDGGGGIGDIVAGGPFFARNNSYVTIDSGGDAETQPRNICINIFIKINNEA